MSLQARQVSLVVPATPDSPMRRILRTPQAARPALDLRVPRALRARLDPLSPLNPVTPVAAMEPVNPVLSMLPEEAVEPVAPGRKGQHCIDWLHGRYGRD